MRMYCVLKARVSNVGQAEVISIKKLLSCVEVVCDKMHQRHDLYVHNWQEMLRIILLKVPFI